MANPHTHLQISKLIFIKPFKYLQLHHKDSIHFNVLHVIEIAKIKGSNLPISRHQKENVEAVQEHLTFEICVRTME